MDRYLQGSHPLGAEAFIGWTGIYRAVTHKEQKPLLAGQVFTGQSPVRSRSLYWLDRYLQGSHPYRPEAFIGWTGIYKAVTCKQQKLLFDRQVLMDTLYLVLPESPGHLLFVVFADPLVLVLVFQHLPYGGTGLKRGWYWGSNICLQVSILGVRIGQ